MLSLCHMVCTFWEMLTISHKCPVTFVNGIWRWWELMKNNDSIYNCVFCAGWPCVTVARVGRIRKQFGCKCGDFHARCDTETNIAHASGWLSRSIVTIARQTWRGLELGGESAVDIWSWCSGMLLSDRLTFELYSRTVCICPVSFSLLCVLCHILPFCYFLNCLLIGYITNMLASSCLGTACILIMVDWKCCTRKWGTKKDERHENEGPQKQDRKMEDKCLVGELSQ